MKTMQIPYKPITVLFLLGLIVACSAGDGSGGGDGPGNPAPADPFKGTGILPDLKEHNNAFKSTYYSGAGQCNTCHNDLQDESGNPVRIGDDWSTSMMANSTRDPYWKAKVAAELDRNPGLKEELDITCVRCHAPMAVDSLQKEGTHFEIFGEDGILNEKHAKFDHAMEGVSCALCHQIEDNGKLGSIDGVSGKFSVKEYANQADRPAFGQYADPSGAYMLAQSFYNPVFSEHISSSESCATCHDLRTPSVDSEGDVITTTEENFFPEQMVFSEWRNSDYAVGGSKEQTCQDCHMPKSEGTVLLASQGGGIPREDFSRHTFLGANTVVQSMLKNYAEELGIAVSEEAFDESISRNSTFLKTAASVEVISSSLQGTKLIANVKVENTTGHKLPSGYPSRRAYLHFLVTNSVGAVVFESGSQNSDGSVLGIDADTDSTTYENHYNAITSSDQVQVYEAIMQDSDANVTHTLLRAVEYVKDNRLLPSGLNKLSASNDIRVVGNASSDGNFDAGGDIVSYQITVPEPGTYNVFVELVYQPLAFGHLKDLFRSVKVKAVDEFKTIFDNSPKKSEIIASTSVVVE